MDVPSFSTRGTFRACEQCRNDHKKCPGPPWPCARCVKVGVGHLCAEGQSKRRGRTGRGMEELSDNAKKNFFMWTYNASSRRRRTHTAGAVNAIRRRRVGSGVPSRTIATLEVDGGDIHRSDSLGQSMLEVPMYEGETQQWDGFDSSFPMEDEAMGVEVVDLQPPVPPSDEQTIYIDNTGASQPSTYASTLMQHLDLYGRRYSDGFMAFNPGQVRCAPEPPTENVELVPPVASGQFQEVFGLYANIVNETLKSVDMSNVKNYPSRNDDQAFLENLAVFTFKDNPRPAIIYKWAPLDAQISGNLTQATRTFLMTGNTALQLQLCIDVEKLLLAHGFVGMDTLVCPDDWERFWISQIQSTNDTFSCSVRFLHMNNAECDYRLITLRGRQFRCAAGAVRYVLCTLHRFVNM